MLSKYLSFTDGSLMMIHIQKVLLLMWKEICSYRNSHNIIWEMKDPRRKDSDLKNYAGGIWRKVARCYTGLKTQSESLTELKPLPLLSVSSNETWRVWEPLLLEEIARMCSKELHVGQLQKPLPASRLPSLPAAHSYKTWFTIATSFPPTPHS